MINLKNATLVIVDSVNPSRANDVLRKCLAVADFRAVFAKSFSFIDSIEKYSEYILRDLNKEIDTDFALIIQWDGFIVNPEAWDTDFMNYDYIGAPWWYENQHNVGNGGFSLRSKKLLEATAKMDVSNFHPEDDVIRQNAELLKTKYGIRFAPEELAAKFSWEENGKYPKYNGSFGFHGASNVNKFLK